VTNASLVNMPPQVEVIDVDSYEPEIEVVAYRKRTVDLTENTHKPRMGVGPSTRCVVGNNLCLVSAAEVLLSSRRQAVSGPNLSPSRKAKRPIDADSKEGLRVKKQRVSNPGSPSLVNIPQPSSSTSGRGGSLKRKDRDIIDLRGVDSDEEDCAVIIKASSNFR
jgi:hypothetical protein